MKFTSPPYSHRIHNHKSHVLSFADPCLQKQRDYTYPSNFNCRSFYQCSKNGRSVPMCCRDFYRFDYNLQECTPDVSCNISCNQREGQEYYNLSADQLMKTDPYGKKNSCVEIHVENLFNYITKGICDRSKYLYFICVSRMLFEAYFW